MTSSKTYTAVYEHDADEDVWSVRIKGVAGCQTYGRSLRQAQGRIREALALWLDVTHAAVKIRDQFPGALAAVADDVVRARSAAERAGASTNSWRLADREPAALRSSTKVPLACSTLRRSPRSARSGGSTR